MTTERFPGRLALSARIREAVLKRILAGELKPGDRLLEMRLADEFGTSQAPVREALRELEMSGLVETSRNRGTRVRAIGEDELAEIYDVRAELEGYAASLAVRELQERLPELKRTIREMGGLARRRDVIGFGEANARFHRLIVEAAGNSTLLEVWSRLDVRSRSALNLVRTSANLTATARSHGAIIEAIETGRAATIRRAIKDHILAFRPQPAPIG